LLRDLVVGIVQLQRSRFASLFAQSASFRRALYRLPIVVALHVPMVTVVAIGEAPHLHRHAKITIRILAGCITLDQWIDLSLELLYHRDNHFHEVLPLTADAVACVQQKHNIHGPRVLLAPVPRLARRGPADGVAPYYVLR
jgi:hypothetical protein